MKFCLIGKTLGHSFSEIMHRGLGSDYTLKELAEEDLPSFFSDCPFDGFNVTIPYKKAVMPFLSGISDIAKRAGAVNTVVKRDGRFYGYNTDYYGITGTFERSGASVKGKNALVLGTGGAACVTALALSDLGAKSVRFVSRTGAINYGNCYDLSDTDIIVNATPVGTSPNILERPIDLSRFKNTSFVFDLIYNPYRTALLRQADQLNIRSSNGLRLLAIQALKAREIWGESTYSEAFYQKTLKILKDASLNIALIGMPSCGKSTVGRIVAEMLGKKFTDTDEEVTRLFGSTPEMIIKHSGEDDFREKEAQAVKIACDNKGAVTALGGGAIMRKENAERIKQTAFVVYLRRDLSLLSTEGRPLSKANGVEDLYRKRAPVYESLADVIVDNDRTAEVAAKEIIEKYESFDR